MESEGSIPCSQEPATGSSLYPMYPVHIFPFYFLKIYSNIIFPSAIRSSEWSLPSNFVLISHLSHECYMPRPPYPPWLDHTNNICWRVQVTKQLIMQSSPSSRHFFSQGQISSSAPCSRTPSICVLPLSVTDLVSHPYKTTGNTAEVYDTHYIVWPLVTSSTTCCCGFCYMSRNVSCTNCWSSARHMRRRGWNTAIVTKLSGPRKSAPLPVTKQTGTDECSRWWNVKKEDGWCGVKLTRCRGGARKYLGP